MFFVPKIKHITFNINLFLANYQVRSTLSSLRENRRRFPCSFFPSVPVPRVQCSATSETRDQDGSYRLHPSLYDKKALRTTFSSHMCLFLAIPSSTSSQHLAACLSLHVRSVQTVAAGFWMLSEGEETARRWPSRVGIYKPRRPGVLNRKAVNFQSLTSRFSDHEFRLIFCMTRVDFYELLELVRPKLTKSVLMGRRGGNATLLPDSRLKITLRMLAGARYGDIMLLYFIKNPTIYDIFHDTVDALNEVLEFPLLPKTEEGLRRLAEGMKLSRSRSNPLTGCIRALDGICIKIKKPPKHLNPALFYCRKGYYAIPVQALADDSYRFLCVSANFVGSTHDSLAHSSSKLGIYLMRGLLGKAYWIAGDEAYICTEFLLTPYPASQAEGFFFRRAFNFFLSSMRIHVEQAFGMIKAKWLILDQLQFETEKCSSLILLTMKLHNYFLDQRRRPDWNPYRSRTERNHVQEESEKWYKLAKQDNFDRVDSFGRCSTFGESHDANFADAPSIKREHFVAHLEVLGLTRPDI